MPACATTDKPDDGCGALDEVPILVGELLGEGVLTPELTVSETDKPHLS